MTDTRYFLPDEKHVITRRIEREMDPITEFVLWDEIQEMRKKGIEPDWLQVFKLKTVRTRSKDTLLLKVTHIQESPAYENKFNFTVFPGEELNGTVFVIDDLTHATMMWAEER